MTTYPEPDPHPLPKDYRGRAYVKTTGQPVEVYAGDGNRVKAWFERVYPATPGAIRREYIPTQLTLKWMPPTETVTAQLDLFE